MMIPCAEQARTLAYFGSTTPCEPLRVGILALFHNRQQQRAQDYQEFVTLWEQLQAQGVWEGLRQTLDAAGAAAAAPETAVPDASDAARGVATMSEAQRMDHMTEDF